MTHGQGLAGADRFRCEIRNGSGGRGFERRRAGPVSEGRLALRLIALVAAVLLGLPLASPASAQGSKALKGVALVIGNGDYEHISPLPNPPNDARAVEEMLDALGFETDVALDRDARRLRRALEGFAEDAEDADVAVIYYSGHGLEAGGENWLVPVDADLSALEDAGEKLVPLSEMVDTLTKTVPVTIVMLDACRSNPFPEGALVRRRPGEAGSPAGSGGLGVARGAVALKATSAHEENVGTVIGFAAEPGHVALDGDPGGNSPYAAAILRHLGAMEGAEFGMVMRMVAEEVYLKTGGRQRPWVNESLRRLLYFGSPAPQPEGAEGAILQERRSLLLTIASLPEAGRHQIETVAKAGGVPMDALYAMLAALGVDAPEDPAELDALLRGQAERLKSMLAEREALRSDDAELQRLSALADRAIDEGALETAVRLLDTAKARVTSLSRSVEDAEADIARKRAEFAAIYARSADAHALALDFGKAAADYEQAYRQVARSDDRLAWTYRHRQTEALERLGTLGGDNAALLAAVDTAADALRLADGIGDRQSRIATQNVLGNVLFTLGDRDSEPARLNQAIAAFRSVLAEEKGMDPGMLAKTRNNLANALTVLGTRSGDEAMLKEAVDLYDLAIDRFEKEENPVLWASAYTNFGKVLIALGELQNALDVLGMAGQAFEAALSVTPRDQQPTIWGAAQNNLGNVHQAIGLRTDNQFVAAGRHLQALTAYRSALQELTRERVPVQWASVQQNLGNTLQSLAYRAPDAEQARTYLRQAGEAQQAALTVMTRDATPAMWAAVKQSMGQTYQMRANLATNPAEASEALKAAASVQREALEVLSQKNAPGQWANAQMSLAGTLQLLSQMETDPIARRGHLVQAEEAQRAALAGLSPDRRSERAAVQHALGLTLLEIAPLDGGTARYEEAEKLFREEQALLSRDQETARWAASQAGIGNALRALGIARRDRATLEEARRRTQEARDVIGPISSQYDGVLSARIAEIDAALAGLN